MARIWSPSTSAPGGVDGEAPVGVAVEGEAEVGARGHDRGLERLGVGGAAAVVDVRAVGPVGEDDAPRRRARASTGAARRRGRPVGAVDARRGGRRGGGPRGWRPAPRAHALDVVGAVDGGADRGAGRRRRVVRRSAVEPASTAASTSSASLRPPAANSLMPLSAKGLCDAEITAPGDAVVGADTQATAGVGATPSERARRRPPTARPAAKAASSSGPERRVSRPTTTRRSAPSTRGGGAPEGERPARG